MFKWWHTWRANKLSIKVEAQDVLIAKLQTAETRCGSSYYTDKLHRAIIERVYLGGALSYHRSKAGMA